MKWGSHAFEDQDVLAMIATFGSVIEFCTHVEDNCDGENKQYDGIEDCVEFFMQMPRTHPMCNYLNGNCSCILFTSLPDVAILCIIENFSGPNLIFALLIPATSNC